MYEIKLEDFQALLPARSRDSHKNMFGHVLIAGGYRGMNGAVRMAGEAALRVGAGLVTIATHSDHSAYLNLARPELMVYGLAEKNPCLAKALFDRATVIAVGPGLSQTSWSQQIFEQVLLAPHVQVVDADALNILAKQPNHSNHWILTPHAGEAARLLACSATEIQQDRVAAAQELQKRYGGIVVLKGAGTLIIDTEQNLFICQAGNPGMASAGMGDVLTGIISGLMAQGLTLADAAKFGVCLHAYAGDLAARDGERGMLAMDLLPHLRKLINHLSKPISSLSND